MKKSTQKRTAVGGYKHGRVPRAIREQQILDVAEQLFISQGYENTTIEDVRLAAGVSRPIIYEHYGSKERLYLACVQRARQHYEQHIVEIEAGPGSALDKIQQGAAYYFGIVEENPTRWMALFGGSAVPLFGELGEQIDKIRASSIEMMATMIKRYFPTIDDEQIDVLAHALFATGEQLGRWWLKNPQVPKARVISHYVTFMWNALSGAVGR